MPHSDLLTDRFLHCFKWVAICTPAPTPPMPSLNFRSQTASVTLVWCSAVFHFGSTPVPAKAPISLSRSLVYTLLSFVKAHLLLSDLLLFLKLWLCYHSVAKVNACSFDSKLLLAAAINHFPSPSMYASSRNFWNWLVFVQSFPY